MLTLAVFAAWLLAAGPALAQGGVALRGQEVRPQALGGADGQKNSGTDVFARRGRYCSNTASILFQACQHQTMDDFFVAKGKCINLSDEDERDKCLEAADEERRQGDQLCRGQRRERLALCRQLGEARYDPDFDPADFNTDYVNPINPNPYFPPTIGHRWDYAGGDEANTIVALNETKLIEGVTCITLSDKRYRNGNLIEDTDDWYGLRLNGTVDFCGEMVRHFETFPGDNPARPELLGTHGQWKTGREGDPSGAYFLASPTVGAIHRQEFSPGNAEDVAVYLSTSYSFGKDPVLDRHVPRDLVDLFCSAQDCVVTGESTALEPGTFHHKYLVTRRQHEEQVKIVRDLELARIQGHRWRTEARSLLNGLGEAIETQFSRWNLTEAEREVALLLLKGLSQKEIATVRAVSERTVREQSRSIYSKAGLTGRAALSAFFLDDLLAPIEGVQ